MSGWPIRRDDMNTILKHCLHAFVGLTLFTNIAGAQNSEGIIALVNDQPISNYDLDQRARLVLLSASVPASEENIQRAREQALRSLMNEKLQLQEAQKFKVETTPEEVDDAISKLAARNQTNLDGITQELAGSGVDLKTLKDKIKAELAWQAIISGRYGKYVRVSDSEIDQAVKRLQLSLKKPQFLVSEIFLEIPSATDEPRVEQQANTLLTQMQEGAPFPLIAQQYSVAPSASSGGDIGWVYEGELQPELLEALHNMQPGQVSLPVRVPGGYYLVALRDKRAGSQQEYVRLQQIVTNYENEEGRAQAYQKLETLRPQIQNCSDLNEKVENIPQTFVNDLGNLEVGNLAPDYRLTISTLQEGEASQPLDMDSTIQMLVLCDRSYGGSAPDRDAVENRLLNQHLSMISRRYLRNLYRKAIIETRLAESKS